MRYYLHRTPLTSLLLLISSLVIADNEDASILGDVETVSIATGMERSIITAPAVASVFDAKYIRDSGARNLTDILNMVPGIHVGHSTATVYSVRGFSSAFNRNILIMVDGTPQDDIAFSDRLFALGKIPIDIIDRVEVSRGPGSALWGSDAFSAVVNIITKSKVPEASSVAISGGSYNTRNARMFTGTNVGGFDISTAFEYSKTDGHEPTIDRDQQTLLDEQFGTNASLAPGKASTHTKDVGMHINFSNEHSHLGLRGYHVNMDMGVGMAAALDPYGNIEREGFEVLYQYGKEITQDINFDTNLSYSQSDNTLDNIHFFPPGAFGIFPNGVILNQENKQNFERANLAFRYSGLSKHYMTLGIGGEVAEVKALSESRNYTILDGILIPTDMLDTISNPIAGETRYTRKLKFVYLQDEWAIFPDWNFTLGIRYDDYDDYGSVTSQRAVLQWNTSHALTTKLLYGRGFRSPTILETKSHYIPALESNPELKPEMLDQIQLVFDYRPIGDYKGRIDLFYHETDDQIRQQNATGGPTFHPENVGDQIGRGLELEFWWNITEHTNFYSYYAYQVNTDKTTNEDAGYTPHHKVFSILQHQRPDGWFFSTKATYIGNRDRVAEDTRSEADNYTFVDLLLRKELTQNLEATLELRNLFDKGAEEAGFGTAFPGDMPLPGRNYYLTLSSMF
jgi:iron complex outermembrane receptor protein